MAPQHGDHFHAEPHFRGPKSLEPFSAEQVPSQPDPPGGLSIPVRGRNQGIHRVIKAAAQKLNVRMPVAIQEILHVYHIVKGLPDCRILKLLE